MHKRRALGIVATVFTVVLLATSAYARPNVQISLDMKKVISQKGETKLMATKAVTPGDVLQYTLTVANNGDSPAFRLEPVGNIPSNSVYLPAAQPPLKYKVLFSVDNGKTFQAEPNVQVSENGKTVLKKAPVESYNKIKWVLSDSLAPGKSILLNYKVKVK